MGTEQDQTTQPSRKVVGNLYYVGTRTLERVSHHHATRARADQYHVRTNVPVLEKSVADLGFRFSDIKIVLGTHAHRRPPGG